MMPFCRNVPLPWHACPVTNFVVQRYTFVSEELIWIKLW
jgi:hypothetical protein